MPAQSVVQTALGGHQSVKHYLVPGGPIYDQRELVYNMLNDIPGITAVKPKAAFYIFPKIDVKKFNIHSDEQFALDSCCMTSISSSATAVRSTGRNRTTSVWSICLASAC